MEDKNRTVNQGTVSLQGRTAIEVINLFADKINPYDTRYTHYDISISSDAGDEIGNINEEDVLKLDVTEKDINNILETSKILFAGRYTEDEEVYFEIAGELYKKDDNHFNLIYRVGKIREVVEW